MNYPVTFAVLFLASFCLAPMSGAAQTDSLAGEYGHNYTEKDGTPVWEVRQKGDTYELLSLGVLPQLEMDIQAVCINGLWEAVLSPLGLIGSWAQSRFFFLSVLAFSSFWSRSLNISWSLPFSLSTGAI